MSNKGTISVSNNQFSYNFPAQSVTTLVQSGSGEGCTPTSITPYIQVDEGSWQQTASVSINSGSSVTFGPQPTSGGSWSWSGCSTSGTSREQTVYPTSSCTATATYTNPTGCQSTRNFTVTVNGSGGDIITLQGYNGKYVSSENGESSMTCNRTSVGNWEKFEVVEAGNGKIALKGNNEMYVSSENGNSTMNCNRSYIGELEKFTKVDAGDGKYALQGNNGLYVSSENGESPITCNRSSIGYWEKFIWGTTTKSASITEGLNETSETTFDLYPNPSTNGDFIIALSNLQTENSGISVYNLLGEKVYEITNLHEGANTITSGLSSGIYIIRVSLSNSFYSRKLVVQ
jgi:hypothetical protein